MAWIEEVPEHRAPGRLREAYARVRRVLGRVVPYYRAYSRNPELLHAHLDFYAAVGASTRLNKIRKELIAVVVSADNGCGH